MNLPNKLTTLRFILVPFFVYFLMYFMQPMGGYIALLIFIVACLTDFLDGRIARKYNLITNFGKLMDPLADKTLVCCALICLTAMGRLAAWITIIVVVREFFISGFRQLAADKGIVMAASWWGKFKTTFQMIMICFLIVDIDALKIITNILIVISVALTLISWGDYVIKNKDVLKD